MADPLTLAGTGLSILGGLFGQRRAERRAAREAQAQRDHELYLYKNRIAMTVQDAAQMGINPYFALSSGSATGWPGSSAPRVVSSEAATAGAFDKIADLLHGQAAEKAAREKAKAELEAVKAKALSEQGHTASKAAPRALTDFQKSHLKTDVLNEDGELEQAPKITSMFGGWWEHHPFMPDGETMEQAYTEAGAWPFSLAKIGMDAGWNLRRLQRWNDKRRATNEFIRLSQESMREHGRRRENFTQLPLRGYYGKPGSRTGF